MVKFKLLEDGLISSAFIRMKNMDVQMYVYFRMVKFKLLEDGLISSAFIRMKNIRLVSRPGKSGRDGREMAGKSRSVPIPLFPGKSRH